MYGCRLYTYKTISFFLSFFYLFRRAKTSTNNSGFSVEVKDDSDTNTIAMRPMRIRQYPCEWKGTKDCR